VAAASITPTLTGTPTPFDESSLLPDGIEAVFTEAWATHEAAVAAGDLAMATASFATIEAAYTQLSLAATPTPTPFPPPIGQPVPVVTQVAPTAMEAVGLVGVGVVIGLIIGVLIGVVIGLIIGRWRE
jgi:ABC-type nitrate/sulfonate/bicarbonate transport system permease component